MRVIVIGAGLMGVSTAYFLGRNGHEVEVLEQREAAGLATSFANSGMVTPSQADPWNSPASVRRLLGSLFDRQSPVIMRPDSLLPMLWWALAFLRNSTPARFRTSLIRNAALANYSLAVFRQIRNDTGIEYDYRGNGTLKIYRSHRAFKRAAGLSEDFSSLGVNLELLDRQSLVTREPALSDIAGQLAGGVYYPDDESGDAHRFCQGLAEQARQYGASFSYDTEVSEMMLDGNRISGLQTSQGPVSGDIYVIAGGSYSPRLARRIGLRLPINPIKGYSATLDLAPGLKPPQMPVIDDARHIAITPLGRRLRVAGMAEFAGLDASVRPQRIEQLTSFLAEVYPRLVEGLDLSMAREWAGLRPYCSDGVPLIGRAGARNLYLNTGHGHLGWSLSAGSGRLLADHISGLDTGIDIRPYRPGRF